jgi:hypothetical protein
VERKDLREIVEQARRSNEPRRAERRHLSLHRSRVARLMTGLIVLGLGLAGIFYAVVRVMHTGNCASGGPYEIAHQCPGDFGMVVGVLVASAFIALVGAGIAAIGVVFPMGISFIVIGTAVLIGGLTAPEAIRGSTVTGLALGIPFIVIGLALAVLGLAAQLVSREESGPVLTAAGLSQLIGATTPKPVQKDESTE